MYIHVHMYMYRCLNATPCYCTLEGMGWGLEQDSSLTIWLHSTNMPRELKSRFAEYITTLHYTHVLYMHMYIQTDTSLLSISVHFASLNFTITALKIDEFSNFLNALTVHQLGVYSSIPCQSKVSCMCHKQSIGKPLTTKNVFCVCTHYALLDRA